MQNLLVIALISRGANVSAMSTRICRRQRTLFLVSLAAGVMLLRSPILRVLTVFSGRSRRGPDGQTDHDQNSDDDFTLCHVPTAFLASLRNVIRFSIRAVQRSQLR